MNLRSYLQAQRPGDIEAILSHKGSRPFEGAVLVEALFDPIPRTVWLLLDTRQAGVEQGNVAVVVARRVEKFACRTGIFTVE